MLNFGLIGCGNVVSYGHKPALTSLADVRLVALADVTEARCKIGQAWFGLADEDLYSDYRELLARPDIDAVTVAVPQQYRRQIVLDALAAGKHVLSEKPLAYSPQEAAELVNTATAANLKLGMVHNYHFLPEYKQIKSLLDAGTIGQTRVITMHYLGVIDNPGAPEYQSDWRHTLAAGGGVSMDMIHAVYLAEWLMGQPAEQVMAFIDAPTYAARQPMIEDLALIQVAFPSGYAAIHFGWGQGVGGVDISGSAGHLRMHYEKYQTSGFNQPAELYTVQNWERTDHPIPQHAAHMENIAQSFTDLYANFHAAVQTNQNFIAPGAAGQRALEVVLGAYISGVMGQVVKLPLSPENPIYQKGLRGMAEMGAWSESKTLGAGLFGLRS